MILIYTVFRLNTGRSILTFNPNEICSVRAHPRYVRSTNNCINAEQKIHFFFHFYNAIHDGCLCLSIAIYSKCRESTESKQYVGAGVGVEYVLFPFSRFPYPPIIHMRLFFIICISDFVTKIITILYQLDSERGFS